MWLPVRSGALRAGGTDVRLNAEIYAYARAKGLFAGLSLEGASLNQDENAIRTFYGEDASCIGSSVPGSAPLRSRSRCGPLPRAPHL